jgi:hypothetical protein
VEKCPDEYFAFGLNSSIPGSDWKDKMICMDGTTVTDKADAEQKIANNICAKYYLKSKEGESAVCTFSVRSFHKLR